MTFVRFLILKLNIMICNLEIPGSEVIKIYFMLISAEYEILNAH